MANKVEFHDGQGAEPMIVVLAAFNSLAAEKKAVLLMRLRDWCTEQLVNETAILGALDSMAVALANHNHKWTKEQVDLYEGAVAQLPSGRGKKL